MSKLLVVKDIVKDLGWMRFLPDPLAPKQKVVAHSDQEGVSPNYIRVKHGKGSVSVFNRSYFLTLGK